MVLTTVRDDQERAEITFWQAPTDDPSSGEVLATLTLDDLETRIQGEPDIDLVVTMSGDGFLEAIATERSTGNTRSLSVEVLRDTPFDDTYRVPPSLSGGGLYDEQEYLTPRKPSRRSLTPLWIVLLLLLFGLGGWVFYRYVIRSAGAPAVETAPAVTAARPDPQPEPPQPEPTPRADTRPAEPVDDTPVLPPAQPRQETSYHIIRGDTLWDISQRFYGTPWLFPEIAERNLIRNPDLIYADDDIILPDRRYLER